MRDAYIVGIDTIKFDKYLDTSIKTLAQQTVKGCLKDAGMDKEALQAIWFSNSVWGNMGQHCIRGQVALRPMGIEGIPITNVENACASGSTALHHAWLGVASGLYDTTMAVGAEKMYRTNKMAMFASFLGGIDFEGISETISGLSGFALNADDQKDIAAFKEKYQKNTSASAKKKISIKDRIKEYKDMAVVGIDLGEKLGYKKLASLGGKGGGGGGFGDHSPFMDIYSYSAREHMKTYGSTIEQLAIIASKNHWHSSMNPNAQYQFEVPVEEVLADRLVSYPLTRSMCAPIGDGAASAIVCSKEVVDRLGLAKQAVKITASILASGCTEPEQEIGERTSKQAYEVSGLGPEDMSVAEVHDATAYGELVQAENLGFCKKGEGGLFAEQGHTSLGGKIPINTSGGLTSRGHPIGASGLGQIHELVTQLRGTAGKRQVENARYAIAENGGGALGSEEASMCIHILEANSA